MLVKDCKCFQLSSRIVPAQMSSITKLRLLIIEMRRSDVFFFSFSSAQNIGNINSVCVIMPPPSPGRMISCCSRDNSRASTDNPGCSDVFVFRFSSAQNFENINSVCVIMPPSFPGRMISCSRDNSPASTDDPGYLGSSRIRKFPESLVRMPRAERRTQIWTVRHVPPPSPSSPPLHLIPAPYTPPTPPLPLSPCSPVVPCGVRMQANCGPVACCGMRLQAPSPSPPPSSPHTLMLTHLAGITVIGTMRAR